MQFNRFSTSFFAIGIVGIHTGLASSIPKPIGYIILKVWFRMGVPFFFVASGYFLASKLEKYKNREERINIAKQICKRSVISLLIFSLIGLIEACISNGLNSNIIKIVHDALFYPLGAMWYVAAMIVATFIITALYKFPLLLGGVSLLGYSWALICNTYYFVIEDTKIESLVNTYMQCFVSARNGFFVGLPIMFCGVVLYKTLYRHKNENIKRWLIVLFGITALTLYCMEVVFCRNRQSIDDSALYCFSPIFATIIFGVGYSFHINASNELSLLCRRFSKILYYFHPVFSRGIIGLTVQAKVQNSVIFFVYVGRALIMV